MALLSLSLLSITHFVFVADPMQWAVEDTRKWLGWIASLYHLGDLTQSLCYNGRTLSRLCEEELTELTGSKDAGQRVADQLEVWNNGKYRYICTSSIDRIQDIAVYRPTIIYKDVCLMMHT